MHSDFFAHTIDDTATAHWQPLRSHLENVGILASTFAADFGAGPWGEQAGRWHDLGKYSSAFQDYLLRASQPDVHQGEVAHKVDHSTAGAQHAVAAAGLAGHILAYVVSGHHSGLLNSRSIGASLEDRLNKRVPDWTRAPDALKTADSLDWPEFIRCAIADRDHFAVSFFTRMLFSCLVDADFLDTESFMRPAAAKGRAAYAPDVLARMEVAAERYVAGLGTGKTPIDGIRKRVRRQCRDAATQTPGLFALTVPTGGGKTMSSLAFALRHAVLHGLKRVVYVIPFTSIIEQNADVFRRALAELDLGESPLVVEHHSNVDIDDQSDAARLASENWDAPLIVTTTVQFYESLFGNRPSKCRKLHNLVKSVVVLDEAQTLPVGLLSPTLRALQELTANYNATVLLCTATQPAVHARPGFPIGLNGVREIMPDPAGLYESLKRVRVRDLGAQTDQEIVEAFRAMEQALCIVNTRAHARTLFEALNTTDCCFHLSASMCPDHRTVVLSEIRDRLATGQNCRVVSTQIVEAGVDLDFPVVFRSLAGLDSIAQSAGRCNRNGKLDAGGVVNVFRSEHSASEKFFAETADVAAQVLALHEDPLSLAAVEHFFRLYYWEQSGRWDSKQILGYSRLVNDAQLPFQFDFARIADEYKIIDDSGATVIVPWSDSGRRLCEELRNTNAVHARAMIRRLQRFTVQVPRHVWHAQLGRGIELVHDRFPVLVSPELHYSRTIGLSFADGPLGSLQF